MSSAKIQALFLFQTCGREKGMTEHHKCYKKKLVESSCSEEAVSWLQCMADRYSSWWGYI